MNMFEGFNLAYFVTVLASLLISLGFHEAMHGYMALKLGDTTAADEGRISLNPLKHIDIFTTVLLPGVMMIVGIPPIFIAKPVPFDPTRLKYEEFGAALVAIAGPLSNLALAVLGAITLNISGAGGAIAYILQIFTWVNIGLFVFNMLPIPPLDGSRLLYAFAPEPIQRIMIQIESVGILFIMMIILLLSSYIGPVLFEINTAIANFLSPQYF
jgi:Zn-dependent protease